MPTVVLKLFTGQVPDGQTKRRLYVSSFVEHNNDI